MDVKTSLLLRKNEWEHLHEHGDGKTVINIHCGQSLEIYLFFFFWGGGRGDITVSCLIHLNFS